MSAAVNAGTLAWGGLLALLVVMIVVDLKVGSAQKHMTVRTAVVWSPTQIDREEGEGRFPKRVRLGTHRNSRVGWPKREVHAWCREREKARQQAS